MSSPLSFQWLPADNRPRSRDATRVIGGKRVFDKEMLFEFVLLTVNKMLFFMFSVQTSVCCCWFPHRRQIWTQNVNGAVVPPEAIRGEISLWNDAECCVICSANTAVTGWAAVAQEVGPVRITDPPESRRSWRKSLNVKLLLMQSHQCLNVCQQPPPTRVCLLYLHSTKNKT